MAKRRLVANAPASHVATCDLPPHTAPLHFDSYAAFEAHYLAEHAFRCSAALPSTAPRHASLAAQRRAVETAPRCGKTFPSAHFLALHVDECHSALAQQRQARGESIVRVLWQR